MNINGTKFIKRKNKINKFFKNDFIKSILSEKKIALKDNKSLASRKSSESIISSLVKKIIHSLVDQQILLDQIILKQIIIK